jgi:hypothetical protein
MGLWKSVEIGGVRGRVFACPVVRGGITSMEKHAEEFVMSACSACTGDYEDPDRTGRTPIEEDNEEQGDVLDAETEEFPAGE